MTRAKQLLMEREGTLDVTCLRLALPKTTVDVLMALIEEESKAMGSTVSEERILFSASYQMLEAFYCIPAKTFKKMIKALVDIGLVEVYSSDKPTPQMNKYRLNHQKIIALYNFTHHRYIQQLAQVEDDIREMNR